MLLSWEKELDEQVALREELVKGAPVQSLGSLAAIEVELWLKY